MDEHPIPGPLGPKERRLYRDRIAHLETELRTWRTKLRQTERLRKLGSWDIDIDSGRLTWSEGTYGIFGLPLGEDITVERALAFYPESSAAEIGAKVEAAIRTGEPYDVTVRFVSLSGQRGWVRSMGQIEPFGGGRRLVGIVEDVTSEVEVQNELRDLAYLDPLTGLPNRRSFQAQLAAWVGAPDRAFALLLIDLDNFKYVNDTCGHSSGDDLLRDVSGRVRRCLGEGDVMARLGGDEFAVLLADAQTGADACRRAEALLRAARCRAGETAEALSATLSIGVALRPEGISADDLFRRADAALYRAKALGRDRVCLFASDLLRAIEGRAETLAGVRHALVLNDLDVYYQPVVDLRTGAVRGLEALVRWRHPRHGIMLPVEFEAAFADPILSVAIDDFVMARAFADMRVWLDLGVNVSAINVNASGAQLKRPDLVEHVLAGLAAHGLAPEHLKIEVLETTFLGRGTERVAGTVAQLADCGIVCLLDDFGMGHASLKHLKQFRLDRIKIDRAFISNMEHAPFDKGLVKSIIDLGHNLGIRVTGEGVETVEQLAMLREFGCDCAQGFLIGRPVPSEEVPAAMLRWYGRAEALLGLHAPTFKGMGSPDSVGRHRMLSSLADRS